jgi:hypothetical protein
LGMVVDPQSAMTVDAVLNNAEGFASGAGDLATDSLADGSQRVKAIGYEMDLLALPESEDNGKLAACHAIHSVYFAVRAAGEAVAGNQSGLIHSVKELIFEATLAAAHAARSVLPVDASPSVQSESRRNATRDCNRAMATDYRTLIALGLGQFPSLGNPVDLSASGPLGSLWPDGEPAWFREGLAFGLWETVEQVKQDFKERQQIEDMTPPYERLRELADHSGPAVSWFEE